MTPLFCWRSCAAWMNSAPGVVAGPAAKHLACVSVPRFNFPRLTIIQGQDQLPPAIPRHSRIDVPATRVSFAMHTIMICVCDYSCEGLSGSFVSCQSASFPWDLMLVDVGSNAA